MSSIPLQTYTGPPLPTQPTPPGNTMLNPTNRQPTEIEILTWPWRYVGYPGLSKWMASSPDFFVLRRFSAVNARYLLYLQHEIGQRERRLEDMDEASKKQSPQMPEQGPHIGSFEREIEPERLRLLQETGALLKCYYEQINATSQVRDKRTADEKHIESLENWFGKYKYAIDENETYWWRRDGNIHDADLFEMKSYPKSPLRSFLNKWRRIRYVFRLRKTRADDFTSPETKYFSNAAFDQFVCLITVLLGLGLLFAPLWYLHFVTDLDYTLGIITGFSSLFAFWLWVAAGPRQFEILIGAAAYAAVLAIYLQASKEK